MEDLPTLGRPTRARTGRMAKTLYEEDKDERITRISATA